MYQQKKLANKFPVLLIPKNDSKSLTLLVLYKVGSRYENLAVDHGVSHFIEHLMFKGTKNRPTTLDISKELDGIGAEFNAFTGKDYTGYYIKANAAKAELACSILSDMLNNSLFDAQEIEREKGVIIEEIKMYEDQPMYFSEMLFERLVFSGNNLGEDIAGTEASIHKMTRQDILDYRNRFYQPQNAIIAVAGKIPKTLYKTLNKYFGQYQLAKNVQAPSKFQPFKNEQKEPRFLLEYRDTKQVHLALGFPAYSYFHKDFYALNLLSVILGGNMSSRLFINVRERKGLCYYIKAQADVYEDTGNLMIRAGLEKNKIQEAIKIILQELREIKVKGVTAKELQMAKDFIVGRTVLQLEESNASAEFFAKQHLLTKTILTPDEKFKKINAVTAGQIKKVAQDILRKDKFNLAMISPFRDKKEFTKLLSL